MAIMHDVEIVWDDLLDGFENSDPRVHFFLDRGTGEVFQLPSEYADETFWHDAEGSDAKFLPIPHFDYEQERILLHEFIKNITNESLKSILERNFIGKLPYGKLDEILSFYPEEMERLQAMKEDLISVRVRHWLEEHDIYPSDPLF